MRKIFMSMFVVFGFCTQTAAAPAYGTKMPEKSQWFFGLQTYKVFERELYRDQGEFDSLQNFAMISIGLTDDFSLDLKGGIGDAQQQPDVGNELNYSTFLAGGYGFRWRFYDQERIKAVFGFQHISVHPYSMKVNSVRQKAVIDDWQFSLLASYDFNVLTPYLGGKWSRMDYIHWQGDDRKRVKSRQGKSMGLVVGTDIPITDRFWINVESQWIDVTAASASLHFHF